MIDAPSSPSCSSRLGPPTPLRLWTNPLMAFLMMLILVWTIVALVLTLIWFGAVSGWGYIRGVFRNEQ